mmetsp:Transcript_76432/g.134858  ORF Transcript_76432/g.134858 Transcript_76432/m.134858 type:complete len:202 (-) Transcript_76432:402-1007(-)
MTSSAPASTGLGASFAALERLANISSSRTCFAACFCFPTFASFSSLASPRLDASATSSSSSTTQRRRQRFTLMTSSSSSGSSAASIERCTSSFSFSTSSSNSSLNVSACLSVRSVPAGASLTEAGSEERPLAMAIRSFFCNCSLSSCRRESFRGFSFFSSGMETSNASPLASSSSSSSSSLKSKDRLGAKRVLFMSCMFTS